MNSCQKYVLRHKLRKIIKPWIKFLIKTYPELPYNEILYIVEQELKEYVKK